MSASQAGEQTADVVIFTAADTLDSGLRDALSALELRNRIASDNLQAGKFEMQTRLMITRDTDAMLETARHLLRHGPRNTIIRRGPVSPAPEVGNDRASRMLVAA